MSELASPRHGETQAHRDLKKLALIWAQSNGFRVAASEVSLPNHRVRMDVAVYRSTRVRELQKDERLKIIGGDSFDREIQITTLRQ